MTVSQPVHLAERIIRYLEKDDRIVDDAMSVVDDPDFKRVSCMTAGDLDDDLRDIGERLEAKIDHTRDLVGVRGSSVCAPGTNEDARTRGTRSEMPSARRRLVVSRRHVVASKATRNYAVAVSIVLVTLLMGASLALDWQRYVEDSTDRQNVTRAMLSMADVIRSMDTDKHNEIIAMEVQRQIQEAKENLRAENNSSILATLEEISKKNAAVGVKTVWEAAPSNLAWENLPIFEKCASGRCREAQIWAEVPKSKIRFQSAALSDKEAKAQPQ